MKIGLLFILVLTFGHRAFGAEVLQVAERGADFIISHESGGQWRAGDSACAVRNGVPVACGYITDVAPGGALVKTALVPRKAAEVAAGASGDPKSATQVTFEDIKPVVGDGARASRVLFLDGVGDQYPISGVNKKQTQAAVKPLPDRAWTLAEAVCFTRKGDTIACGYVVQAAASGAIVQISLNRRDAARVEIKQRPDGSTFAHVVMRREPIVQPGDGQPPGAVAAPAAPAASASVATAAPPAPAPAPAVTQPVAPAPETKPAAEENPTPHGNVTLGFDYTFPTLFFQYTVAPKFSVGLAMQLVDYPSSRNGGNVRGSGALLSINYYADDYFRGVWLQGAIGLYSLKADKLGVELKTSAIDVQAAFGWRWGFGNGMNLGFAVGANYVSPGVIKTVVDDFSGVLPALLLDIGFNLF